MVCDCGEFIDDKGLCKVCHDNTIKELETTKRLLEEARSIFQEIYDGSSDKFDRSLAKEFLAKLSKEGA